MIISPAMLKIFEECPQKYKFMYVDKISLPQNKYFFEKGKKIHALASYYIKGFDVSKLENALNETERKIWNYLKSTEYFKYEFLKSEYQLNMKITEYWIGGRLDALVKDENNYYILDYKTGSAPKNAKYDFQTIIYIMSVKEFFKTDKVTFVYIDLKNRDEVKIEYSQELEVEYQKKLLDAVKNIELEDVPLKKMDCKCEYSLICY